jgi:hypothetical protein
VSDGGVGKSGAAKKDAPPAMTPRRFTICSAAHSQFSQPFQGFVTFISIVTRMTFESVNLQWSIFFWSPYQKTNLNRFRALRQERVRSYLKKFSVAPRTC